MFYSQYIRSKPHLYVTWTLESPEKGDILYLGDSTHHKLHTIKPQCAAFSDRDEEETIRRYFIDSMVCLSNFHHCNPHLVGEVFFGPGVWFYYHMACRKRNVAALQTFAIF